MILEDHVIKGSCELMSPPSLVWQSWIGENPNIAANTIILWMRDPTFVGYPRLYMYVEKQRREGKLEEEKEKASDDVSIILLKLLTELTILTSLLAISIVKVEETLKISYHPVKFGGNKQFGNGDTMVLICHLILQDHGTKGSSNSVSRNLSK